MAQMNDDEEVGGGSMLSQDELDALLAAASAETETQEWPPEISAQDEAAEPQESSASVSAAGPSLVDLPSFDLPDLAPASSHEPAGMSRVRDVPLEVTVELGRTRLLIRDILDLGAGSIIELDKIAGEPVELFANGLLMARGEVVVIDDNFGVRVTEILTAADRKGGKDAHALAA